MIEEFTMLHFIGWALALLGTAAFGIFVLIPWGNRIIDKRTESFHEGVHDDLHEDELYEHFHEYSGDADLTPQEKDDG